MFRIVSEIPAHDGPIRALCMGPLGDLISGSQDTTVRRWALSKKPIGDSELELIFEEFGSPIRHNHWVTAVTSLSADKIEIYSNGCVVTGSQDSIIRIYDTFSNEMNSLTGHTKGVISFSWTSQYYLASGSWDGTARIWDLTQGICLQVLGPHENGVHVLGLPDGKFITTSTGEQVNNRPANYFIRMWDITTGKQLGKSLADHDGPIRSITAVSPDGFATSSNDGTVKLRTTDGHLVTTLVHNPQDDGSMPFVLDVISLEEKTTNSTSTSNKSEGLVSCGEDGSVMVWINNQLLQTLSHPCSVWCACTINENEFVTAGHDGILRLFSRDPKLCESNQSAALQVKFEEEVQEAITKRNRGPDDAEIAKLTKWMDRYSVVGRADGEYRIFNKEGTGVAAQWSGVSKEWIEIGEVVGKPEGSSTGSQSGGGAIDGVVYDHVMPVEIDTAEGPKNLKLGYNNGENVFSAAQRFLDNNMLNRGYLNQVADWITSNAGVSQRPTFDLSTNTSTSASGPVPLVGMPSSLPPRSYSTSTTPGSGTGSSSDKSTSSTSIKGSFIPISSYFTFEDITAATMNKIISKIQELNTTAQSSLSSAELELISQLGQVLGNMSFYHASSVSNAQINAMLKMLSWSSESLFPCYDILRLVVVHPEGAMKLGAAASSTGTTSKVLSSAIDTGKALFASGSNISTNTIVTVSRFFCNLFKTTELRKTIFSNIILSGNDLNPFLEEVILHVQSPSKLVRFAIVSFFCNCIVITKDITKATVKEMLLKKCLEVLQNVIQFETDSIDVVCRSLIGMGTAITIIVSTGEINSQLTLASVNKSEILRIIDEKWKAQLLVKYGSCYDEFVRLL